MKIFQYLLYFLLWLTISPLFFFYAKKRNLLGKKIRIIALVLSPMILIFIMAAGLMLLSWYAGYRYDRYRESLFSDGVVLQQITGVKLPEFEVTGYKKGRQNFTGDFSDSKTIKFKNIPESFYTTLDSICTADEYWSVRREGSNMVYSYDRTWGNGYPVPEGRDEEEDMTLNIWIKKGSPTAIIGYGAW